MLATPEGNLAYLDFGMMSEAPEYARYAIIAHVVHLVNRDYQAMCRDYYTLEFMDKSVDTSPIAPALANFFDDVLDDSVAKLNFKSIVDGLGSILLKYPFQVPAYYALILRSLTVLEGRPSFQSSLLHVELAFLLLKAALCKLHSRAVHCDHNSNNSLLKLPSY